MTGASYLCKNCSCTYTLEKGIPQFCVRDAPVESFDTEAFEFLFDMEQKHFWHAGRREIILEVLKSIPDISRAKILEIGCGNGSVLAFLEKKGLNVEGGDIFLEGLNFCRQRANSIPLYQLDVLALPFFNDYDVIGLFDVLEHIEDDEKALKEISNALKPRGKILLTLPAHQFLWSYWDEASKHQRRYSRKEIIAKLEKNGFVVLKATYYISFLFPLFLGSRLAGKLRRKKHLTEVNKSIEAQTIPMVNRLLLWTLRIEKKLLRYVNLPLGASLLILAEKK
jgi:SAM-dependent methyltransferase